MKGKLRWTWSKQLLKYQFEVIGISMKNAIYNALIVGLSGALLWHFSNIWRYEQYLIAEPNIVIRSLETVALLIILVFGIGKYISDLKREIRKGDMKRDRRQ